MSSMRRRVFETVRRPSPRSSRTSFSSPIYRRSYHASSIPTIRSSHFEIPTTVERQSSSAHRFRSVTPPPHFGSSSQPTFFYEAHHSMPNRNRDISPRRTDGTSRNYDSSSVHSSSTNHHGNRDISPRSTNGNHGNYEVRSTSSHSSRPVDTRYRSHSLPRNRAYGNATGSRFVEDHYTPEMEHNFSPPRHIDLTRLPGYSTDYHDPRNDRNLSSGTTTTTTEIRSSAPYPTGGTSGHGYGGTIPRSNYSDRRTDRSIDINVPKPVAYFTYSDDEDDNRTYNHWNENSNSTRNQNNNNNDNRPDINVTDIDLHVAENSRDHHTDRFSKSRDKFLIVRRAQNFRVSVNISTRFSESEHDVCLEFTTGPSPQPGKETYIKLSSASPLRDTDTWSLKIERVMGNRVTLVVETSPETIVGEWKMAASISYRKEDGNRSRARKEAHLYILFNPWDRGDAVYFPNKDLLAEYVLNDSGVIFTGGYDQIAAKPWFYGQFESGILDTALLCIRKAFKSRPKRAMGDPVRVSRAISKIVNSNDDNGVLSGNWSGNYRNGTAPLAWVGSVSILRAYMKTNMPVKYGQCFVFAGIVTTICRAVGIPCRTVTNFSSAHDTDGSVTVDVHWDTDGNSELTSLNTDSIWNFHVWNDVWTRRKDLPAGNDGWQVLDSTPQETSDGDFRCGPSPLTAILNGKCDVNYDTAFIYAEVNADRVHWSKQDDGGWQTINIDKSAVGKMLSTKKPDGLPIPDNFDDCEKFRDDITSQYKYLEGSDRERMSVLSATQSAPRGLSRIYTKDNDVKIQVLTPKSVKVGEDFDVVIELSNSSGVLKTLSGRLLCEVTKYTGKVVRQCKKEALNTEIEAYQQQRVSVHVRVEEYVDAVSEGAMFRFAMISKVKETGQQLAGLETFRLRLPDLEVKIRDRFLRTGVPVDIMISFHNPFKNRSLTNCLILAECPGMEHMKVFSTRNVLADEKFQTTIQITPDTRGTCPLFMTFNSDQIHDIKGSCTLYVQ